MIGRASTAPATFFSQRDTAAERQAHGLARLSSLGSAHRQIVSLPGATSRTQPTIATQNLSARSSAPAATPVQVPASLSPAQTADQERRDLLLDRVLAEKEFLSYISRGLEKGETLIRYWDVS